MNSCRATEFVPPAAQNNNFDAIQNDLSSSNQLASTDDYIQAIYFNSDAKINVTCPSCNGAFRNLDSNENPMTDHARRFPHCAYVRQLQGIVIYRQIHESNCAQQSMFKHYKFNDKVL
jgi:ssDNA-binding Zn-finger/Zn-ribbon topoisomerase 1